MMKALIDMARREWWRIQGNGLIGLWRKRVQLIALWPEWMAFRLRHAKLNAPLPPPVDGLPDTIDKEAVL